MEKNKKLLLIIMLLLALITIIISIALVKPEEKEEPKEIEEVETIEEEKIDNIEYFKEKNLLVQKNYIYGDTANDTYGTFILTDGSIYEYRNPESNTGNSLDSMIENSTKLNKKVSNQDLKLIKEYINYLKDDVQVLEEDSNIETEELTMIKVYSSEKAYLLKSEGITSAENKTKEGQELLRIINKYFE